MTTNTNLEELRELREVVARARVIFECLRTMRGIPDICIDMKIGEPVIDQPESPDRSGLLDKLTEHFENQDSTREVEDYADALMTDALTRLDGVIQSASKGAQA